MKKIHFYLVLPYCKAYNREALVGFISRTTSNLSFCLTSNHLSIADDHKISRDTCRFSLHSQMNDLYMEF